MRLTDRNAILVALRLAIDYEEATLDAYSNQIDGTIDETHATVILARQRIAAFKRVLDRYFGGSAKPPLRAKTVSMHRLLTAPDQDFDPTGGDQI